jgi:perosamine synthetase
MKFRERFIPAAVTPVFFQDIVTAYKRGKTGLGVELFERNIAKYIGVNGAYSFTSFMRANYTCLTALKEQDERKKVILPRYSCPSFAHAIIAAGLSIEYCDTNPETMSIDIRSLESIDTKDVIALICVNYFGLINPMEKIASFCKKNNIYLIEDLGYALGSEYDNRKAGTFGDFSVLNFQEGKALPIVGGMVTTNNTSLIERCISNRRKKAKSNYLIPFGYSFFSKPKNYNFFMKCSSLAGSNIRKKVSMEDTMRDTNNEYDFIFDAKDAFNSMSDFQGHLGMILLDRMEDCISARYENAQKIEKLFTENNMVSLIKKEREMTKTHYIRYPLRIRSGLRDELVNRMCKNKIQASSMYTDFGLEVEKELFPGAHCISNELVTIPCHPFLTEDDLSTMENIIDNI